MAQTKLILTKLLLGVNCFTILSNIPTYSADREWHPPLWESTPRVSATHIQATGEKIVHASSSQDALRQALELIGDDKLDRANITYGSMRHNEGQVIGIEQKGVDAFKLRDDFDLQKGPHFNVEIGRGDSRIKIAIVYPQKSITPIIKEELRPRDNPRTERTYQQWGGENYERHSQMTRMVKEGAGSKEIVSYLRGIAKATKFPLDSSLNSKKESDHALLASTKRATRSKLVRDEMIKEGMLLENPAEQFKKDYLSSSEKEALPQGEEGGYEKDEQAPPQSEEGEHEKDVE